MSVLLRSRTKIITAIILIIVLMTAFGLRFYGLSRQSLWRDEFITLSAVNYDSLKKMYMLGLLQDVHPPAYYFIMYWFVKLFGDSEISMRMPSAIFGVLSVFGTYLVGRFLYSNAAGLSGAALMAVSWTSIYYSQEARYGMMTVFATVFSVYFYLNLLVDLHKNQKFSLGIFLKYFIFAVFSCYSHLFGLLFIVFQAILSIILFFHKRKQIISLIALYLLIAVAFTFWLPTFIYQFTNNRGLMSWVPVPTLETIWYFLLFVYSPSSPLTTLLLSVISVYFCINLLRTIISKKLDNLGIVNKTRSDLPISADSLLILWFVIPPVIIYIISIYVEPIFVDRYFLFVLPAAYLLLTRSILGLPFINAFFKFIAIILLVGLQIYNLVFFYNYYTTPQKEPFREVTQYILDNDMKNSYIMSNVGPELGFNYYFGKLGSSHKIDIHLWYPKNPGKVINEFIEEQRPDYIWYISQHYSSDDAAIKEYLEDNLYLVKKVPFVVQNSVWFDLFLFRNSKVNP